MCDRLLTGAAASFKPGEDAVMDAPTAPGLRRTMA